jgi:hypothetical protein
MAWCCGLQNSNGSKTMLLTTETLQALNGGDFYVAVAIFADRPFQVKRVGFKALAPT